MARNHWDTYAQQVLLTVRHAELDLAREEFIATPSHEVRTPLASILGYVELLEDARVGPEDAARFLNTIRRNADRLRDLSEDLHVLSHWETEQRRRESGEEIRGEVDLVEVVRRVGRRWRRWQRTRRSLEIDVPNEPLTEIGSASRSNEPSSTSPATP